MNEVWKDFVKENKKIPLSSFAVKDILNSKIWQPNHQIKPKVRQKLLKIADDFIKKLDLPDSSAVKDITFTGSLANFNWSEFSDVDLHLIVEFGMVDENIDLVKEYFAAKQTNWNRSHNIKMYGHEVEIYVEQAGEPHVSTGVYSVQNNRWIVTPFRSNPRIDYETINKKAICLMTEIDKACDLFCNRMYSETISYAEKMKEKLRKFRRAGLYNGGQFSVENLTFKVLRRNGYLKKLSDLLIESYDRLMSLNGDYQKSWTEFLEGLKDPNILDEVETFQQMVKKGYPARKHKTIGLGKQPNTEPYDEAPPRQRSKSAPVGYGGS